MFSNIVYRFIDFYMDAIDSDDNSIVGFSLGGNMSELDSRDINKNGEIKSKS